MSEWKVRRTMSYGLDQMFHDPVPLDVRHEFCPGGTTIADFRGFIQRVVDEFGGPLHIEEDEDDDGEPARGFFVHVRPGRESEAFRCIREMLRRSLWWRRRPLRRMELPSEREIAFTLYARNVLYYLQDDEALGGRRVLWDFIVAFGDTPPRDVPMDCACLDIVLNMQQSASSEDRDGGCIPFVDLMELCAHARSLLRRRTTVLSRHTRNAERGS